MPSTPPSSLRSRPRSSRRCAPAPSCSALPSSASRRPSPPTAGRPHAIAVNTGTSALHLALLAAGVGPGDEVITVSATFVATTAAILYAGATPVFVDIDRAHLDDGPGADRGGDHPADQGDPARPPARPPRRHGRDHRHRPRATASSSSRTPARRMAPSATDAAPAPSATSAAFSFYPGKNLGAAGEGGGITTNDAGYAEIMRSLRDWGQAGKYNHVRHGFNYRMDGVQGAALGVKLPHLDAWNAARRRIANALRRRLRSRPRPRGRVRSAPTMRAMSTRSAPATARRCAPASSTRASRRCMHYPTPVHLQPAYADLGYRRGDAAGDRGAGAGDPVAADLPGDAATRTSRGSSMPSTPSWPRAAKPPEQE